MAQVDEDEESPTAPEAFTVQVILDLLRSTRRRYAVRVLADKPPDDPVLLDDLADAVARREAGHEAIDDVAHKAVVASLHQNHLPKLERHGAVTTASTNELLVIPRQRIQTLADILAFIDTRTDDDPAGSRWPGSTLVSAVIDCVRRYRPTSR